MVYDNICLNLQCDNITKWGMGKVECMFVNCKLINRQGIEFNIHYIPKQCINKNELQKHRMWEKLQHD